MRGFSTLLIAARAMLAGGDFYVRNASNGTPGLTIAPVLL
jgi:hypothetical protein